MVTAKGGILLTSDYYTASGGNVLSLIDHAKPSRTWAITGTLPEPTADAAWNGALVLAPSGTQYGVCSEPASSFKWMHDGSPVWSVRAWQRAAGASCFLDVTTGTGSSVGYRYVTNTVNDEFYLSSVLVSEHDIPIVIDAPTYTDHEFQSPASPEITHRRKGTIGSQGDTTAGVSPLDPAATVGLWRRATAAGLEFVGEWTTMMHVPGLASAGERALVQAWLQADYGLAPRATS
jgi:hypothetical protein